MGTNAYGARHQRSRRTWDAELQANGPTTCRRCGQPVYPDQHHDLNPDRMKFDLGHGVDASLGGDGHDSRPEHAHCNRSAGRRLRMVLEGLKAAPRTTREW